MNEEKRWTVSVDFDGVIHSYATPWIAPHVIPDPPVPGAIGWLHQIIQVYDVVIFSTRCRTWRGRRAIKAWLKKHSSNIYRDGLGYTGIEDVKLSHKKLPALVYVDDRGYRFTGSNFPTVGEIHKMRPWNK